MLVGVPDRENCISSFKRQNAIAPQMPNYSHDGIFALRETNALSPVYTIKFPSNVYFWLLTQWEVARLRFNLHDLWSALGWQLATLPFYKLKSIKIHALGHYAGQAQ